MGICIFKNNQDLETICSKQAQFKIDENRNKLKSISVWKITEKGSESLTWPYSFYSSSSYIIIVANRTVDDTPILQQDRTSIQLAQMLFRAQFLIRHLKISKKLMLNNKQYGIRIYSFYGDSVDDESMTRSQLTYYVDMLERYLEFNAGCFCLSMLNQSQPVAFKNQLKQFIDFQSEQYSQAYDNQFFRNQLFGIKKKIKQELNQGLKVLMFNNFTHGSDKLPYIQIKESVQRKQKQNKKKDLDQSLPFACQITQINIKGNEKMAAKQAVQIESQNLIFDDLGMGRELQQVDKIQQFLKGLYLATQKTSKNYQLLNQNKIKLIINCAATTCKNWFVNDVSYKWIDMADPVQNSKHQYNIECLIYQVADLAGKCLAEPAGVLIHCSGYNPKIQYSGSRSAAILIGIIMSSLKLSYEDAYNMVNKQWPITIPSFMQKQLKNLSKRSKQKPKGFNLYSICSYSKNFPKHLVAKYLCEIQQIQNLQGIDKFEKSVFLCIGQSGNKIMWGRECQYRQDYEKYAKQQLRLLNKYEKVDAQVAIQPIQKTFRKQPKIQIKQQILHIDTKGVNKNVGFLRNQEIVLKYPILRPVWQKKKQDAFYFTIRQKNSGAEVIMNKGMNWIGYQTDKQQFFDRIINCYLGHIPHDKIFILQSEQDQSLFDASINI